MKWKSLVLVTLFLGACTNSTPKKVSNPEPAPRPTRPSITPKKTEPMGEKLAFLLEELQEKQEAGVFMVREFFKGHLDAKRAEKFAKKAAVTVLTVGEDPVVGALVEVIPSPSKRCSDECKDATHVYWIAVQKEKSGKEVISANEIKTEIFSGKTPSPKVTIPMVDCSVTVFSVKYALSEENMCESDRYQWDNLEAMEAYSAVNGKLHRIASVNTNTTPQMSGANQDNTADVLWINGNKKTCYFVATEKTKRSTPMNAVPDSGNGGGTRYSCSRTTTVYEVTASGSKKLSPFELTKLKKSNSKLRSLPKDKEGSSESVCDNI